MYVVFRCYLTTFYLSRCSVASNVRNVFIGEVREECIEAVVAYFTDNPNMFMEIGEERRSSFRPEIHILSLRNLQLVFGSLAMMFWYLFSLGRV